MFSRNQSPTADLVIYQACSFSKILVWVEHMFSVVQKIDFSDKLAGSHLFWNQTLSFRGHILNRGCIGGVCEENQAPIQGPTLGRF